MAKLQGNDAAMVAAALTQAEAAVLGGLAAGPAKPPKLHHSNAGDLVRLLYQQHLLFVLGYDPRTGEGGVSHDRDPLQETQREGG